MISAANLKRALEYLENDEGGQSLTEYAGGIPTLLKQVLGKPGATPAKIDSLVDELPVGQREDAAKAILKALVKTKPVAARKAAKPMPIAKLRAAATKLVLAQTAKAQTANFPADIQHALTNHSFGCQAHSVRDLVSILLTGDTSANGVFPTLSLFQDDGRFELVLAQSDESDEAVTASQNGDIGEWEFDGDEEPATPAQVRAFMAKYSEENLRRDFSFLDV